MNDHDIICKWMGWITGDWAGGEGPGVPAKWTPLTLSLDVLYKVEARLTDDQWWEYSSKFNKPCDFRSLIHLSAEQKIKALADTIRSIDKGATYA